MQHVMQFEYADSRPFRVIDIDGEPWFILADVCRELEVGNPSDAAKRLDEDEKRTLDKVEGGKIKGLGTVGAMPTIISESGLYSLVLTSRKPNAKLFKKWITAEVLPSIRKTGQYRIGGRTPAFIQRFNENWDRVSPGHFSIISELTVRLYGRLEMLGYVMADRAKNGRELRPDVSVGLRFPKFLGKKYPSLADKFSMYLHKTPETEIEARQYEMQVLPAYIDFVDNVWIPECAENYFKSRDPAALPYLPRLLPMPHKAKPVAVSRKRIETFGVSKAPALAQKIAG